MMRIYFLLYNRIDSFSNAWNAPKILKYQALIWINMLITANLYSVFYPIWYYSNFDYILHVNFLYSFTLLFIILLFLNYYIFFKGKEYQQFYKEKLSVYNIKKVNLGVIIYVILTVATLSIGMSFIKNGHL